MALLLIVALISYLIGTVVGGCTKGNKVDQLHRRINTFLLYRGWDRSQIEDGFWYRRPGATLYTDTLYSQQEALQIEAGKSK